MNASIIGRAALWTARVLGALFFVFIAFFVVAHALSPDGLPPLWRASVDVQLDSLALILMVFGGGVGWKWPRAATIMILSGYAIWQLVERRAPWPPGLIELPLIIGLLYAFALWRNSRQISTQKRAMQ